MVFLEICLIVFSLVDSIFSSSYYYYLLKVYSKRCQLLFWKVDILHLDLIYTFKRFLRNWWSLQNHQSTAVLLGFVLAICFLCCVVGVSSIRSYWVYRRKREKIKTKLDKTKQQLKEYFGDDWEEVGSNDEDELSGMAHLYLNSIEKREMIGQGK